MAFGFSFSHKTKDIKNDYKALGKTGQSIFDAGTNTTNEGLGDLRELGSTFADSLKNPLGTGPNSAAGIFARARGSLSDTATRATSGFGARLFQQARQGGGALSPEAQAQLQEQNARDVNQSLFEGNVAISDKEASAWLTETSKIFDRMTDISKTILGVGQNRETLGLQTLLATITGRQSLAQGNAAAANAAVGTAISGGTLASRGAGSGSVSTITGKK